MKDESEIAKSKWRIKGWLGRLRPFILQRPKETRGSSVDRVDLRRSTGHYQHFLSKHSAGRIWRRDGGECAQEELKVSEAQSSDFYKTRGSGQRTRLESNIANSATSVIWPSLHEVAHWLHPLGRFPRAIDVLN